MPSLPGSGTATDRPWRHQPETPALPTAAQADLAAKTLSEAVGSAIPAGSAVTVWQRVIEGHAARVLLDAEHDTDLLVVGSHG